MPVPKGYKRPNPNAQKPLPTPPYVEPTEPPTPDGRYTPPRIRIKPKKHED